MLWNRSRLVGLANQNGRGQADRFNRRHHRTTNRDGHFVSASLNRRVYRRLCHWHGRDSDGGGVVQTYGDRPEKRPA